MHTYPAADPAAVRAAVAQMDDATLSARIRQLQVLVADAAARKVVADWARARGHGNRDVYAGAMQLLPVLEAVQAERRRGR